VRTRANALKLLSQVLGFALHKGWCVANPCTLAPHPRVRPSADIRFLGRKELEALLAAVDIEAKPFGRTDRAIILTAALTGLRQGELLALRWRDVDWRSKRVRVRRNYVRGHWGTPKSRRGERSVPMASRLARELCSHREGSRFSGEDDLVFAHPETGEVLSHDSLRRRFKRAVREAGIRDLRFHDLRHTFGTRIAASPDISMRDLQAWMGHEDIRTTLIYADYEPADGESKLIDAAFS